MCRNISWNCVSQKRFVVYGSQAIQIEIGVNLYSEKTEAIRTILKFSIAKRVECKYNHSSMKHRKN